MQSQPQPMPDPSPQWGSSKASHKGFYGFGSKSSGQEPSDPGPWFEEAARRKFDGYLLTSLMALEDAYKGQPDPYVPVLMRVAHACAPGRLPEQVLVTSRVADIVACTATLGALREMVHNSEVLWVDGSRRRSPLETGNSLKLVKANVVHSASPSEEGDRALVAIVDDGIDVLHEAFRDSSGKYTRIRYIWDQTDSAGTGPATGLPEIDGVGGTVYDSNQIDDFISGHSRPPGILRDARGHGTHVASIAAGLAGKKFKGGLAPAAQLVVVIPKHEVNHDDPKTLGYSNSHIAALEYIKHVANKLQLPTVVNLSGGTSTGAHDGTSLLEAAFNAVVTEGRQGGYVVVKSAGNEGDTKTHAEVRLSENVLDVLEWSALKAPQQETLRIELWFRSCDDLHFRLVDPSGNHSKWVQRKPKSSLDKGTLNQNDYYINLKRYHPDNGDSQLVIQIDPGARGEIPTGKWRLEIDPKYVFDGYLYAWIERTDTTTTVFVSQKHITVKRTLTVPGTASTVIAVGNALLNPVAVASDSSNGPTRDSRCRPDVIAPGKDIEAALSGTTVEVVPMSGTSQAAAHVSGAIALVLSAQEKKRKPNEPRLNAAQIRAALTQTTQTNHYQWNEASGSGLLDVKRLVDAFD